MHYLAVRLFYEAELVSVEANRQWRVSGTLPAIARVVEARGEPTRASVGANKLAVCRDAWRVFQVAQLLGLTGEAARAADEDSRDDPSRLARRVSGRSA